MHADIIQENNLASDLFSLTCLHNGKVVGKYLPLTCLV